LLLDFLVPVAGRLHDVAAADTDDLKVQPRFQELRAQQLVVGVLGEDADDIHLVVRLIRGGARLVNLELEDRFHEVLPRQFDAGDLAELRFAKAHRHRARGHPGKGGGRDDLHRIADGFCQ
jgi:hypothetical protein